MRAEAASIKNSLMSIGEGDGDSGFQAGNNGLLAPYSIASEDFAICRSTNF
jgi:hypothetical protein